MSDDRSDDAPAKTAAADEGPFSLIALRKLVGMMERHGLTEVSLKSGDVHWKLRRGPEPTAAMPVALPTSAAPAVAPAAPTSVAPPAAVAAKPIEGPVIKSPTVGTYYPSPSPDDPPFVTVGSRVERDTIVCLIEAMKVFNQIPAEASGVIAEVLVANGDSVEYGQPLFRLKPA